MRVCMLFPTSQTVFQYLHYPARMRHPFGYPWGCKVRTAQKNRSGVAVRNREAWRNWHWPDARWVNFAILTLLSAIFFHPIFLHPTEVLWGNDIVRADSAFKVAMSRNLWTWHTFSLWDPTILGGRSIVGDPIYALLNPSSLVFWFSTSPLVFGHFAWLHVLFGSWGMFLLSRNMSCSSFGSALAAVVFAYSGKVAAHIFAGHLILVATVMCLPWLMIYVLRILDQPRTNDVLILGALVAFTISYGTMHILYTHALFVGTFAFAQIALNKSDRKSTVLKSIFLVSAGLLGLGLSAAIWFPAVRQTLMLSERAGGASMQFASMGAAQLSDLLRFVWPFMGIPAPTPMESDAYHRFFWESMSFPGLVALTLVPAACYVLRKDRTVWILGGLALVFTVLTFASVTPLFEIAFKFLPGFSLFRSWGRLFFYVIFVVAVISGKLVSERATVSKLPIFLSVFLALQFCFVAVLSMSTTDSVSSFGLWSPIITLALLTTGAFLWATNLIPLGAWQVWLLTCCVGELLFVWHYTIYTVPVDKAIPNPDAAQYLAELKEAEGWRVLDTTNSIPQQVAVRHGIEIVGGYHPGMYASQVMLYSRIWRNDTSDATELVPHQPEDIVCPAVLDILGVRYLISSHPVQGMSEEFLQRVKSASSDSAQYIYRRRSALPRAFVVGGAEVPPPGLTVAEQLCSIDPRKTCLVEDEPIPGSAPFQEIKIHRISPAAMDMHFNMPAPGVVVVSQTWHPDWRATDNGAPVPAIRVNGGLVGIPLQAGDHALNVRYVPWDFYLGAAVSAGFGLAMIASATALRLVRVRSAKKALA